MATRPFRPFRVTGINGRIDDILVPRTKFNSGTIISQALYNISTSQSAAVPTVVGNNGTFVLASGAAAGSNASFDKPAYSALRIRVQATSAGSPGSTNIGLTYTTGLGVFTDKFRVLARADIETTVYVLGGNILGNEFYHAPIQIYADVVANGVFPGLAARSVSGTYTGGTAFTVTVDAVTAQGGVLDEFLRDALNVASSAQAGA